MPVSILRGATLTGAVLGTLVLAAAPPAMAAGGTGSITGHLTTAAGAAATNIEVDLYTDNTQGRRLISWITTDGEGGYHFGNLDTGSYVLGFSPFRGPTQYYHHQATLTDADGIAVTTGAVTTADEQLLATGAITGQIRDASGNPVPYLSMSAQEQKPDGSGVGGSGYGVTGEDGRYRIPVLAGRYTVSFDPIPGSYQSQYVPGKIDVDEATRFEVPADGEVVADDTVLGIGSLSGRLTTASGAPLVGATVNAGTSHGGNPGDATTDGDGQFSMPGLLAGAYHLYFWQGDRYQYYQGKLDAEKADPVVVTANEDTRVTDSLLPTGSIRVAAVNASSGKAIADFCVDGECSDGTGTVTITDRVVQPYQLQVTTPDGSYFGATSDWITPVAGETIDVTVKLSKAARITTAVVDRATGLPVRNVCVSALALKDPRLPAGYGNCTDSAGKMIIGPLAPGSYNLFADPVRDHSYGQQWVAEAGGTGDQRSAVTLTVKAGQTAASPTVRLDRAGTITGRVTDAATGGPLADGRVNLLGYHPGSGAGSDVVTDAGGHYEVTGLGPYAWPLLFEHAGFPTQWSGGVPNRYNATPVAVTAAASVTYDAALVQGVQVRGTFTNQDGKPMESGHLMVHNNATGDIIGATWMENGRYALPVLPSQPIYFSYSISDSGRSYDGRYVPCGPDQRSDGADALKADALKAGVFKVPGTGTLTVDIAICTG